jgi:hypothetical protein
MKEISNNEIDVLEAGHFMVTTGTLNFEEYLTWKNDEPQELTPAHIDKLYDYFMDIKELCIDKAFLDQSPNVTYQESREYYVKIQSGTTTIQQIKRKKAQITANANKPLKHNINTRKTIKERQAKHDAYFKIPLMLQSKQFQLFKEAFLLGEKEGIPLRKGWEKRLYHAAGTGYLQTFSKGNRHNGMKSLIASLIGRGLYVEEALLLVKVAYDCFVPDKSGFKFKEVAAIFINIWKKQCKNHADTAPVKSFHASQLPYWIHKIEMIDFSSLKSHIHWNSDPSAFERWNTVFNQSLHHFRDENTFFQSNEWKELYTTYNWK